jgi:hypothetical protein
MFVRLAAAACLAACLAFAQLPRPATTEPPANTSGIAPRNSPAAYPVMETAPGITVACAVLTPAQIKKLFPMNLDSAGYVVVEVGLFPDKDTQITVDPDQFRLQIGDDRTLRSPVPPSQIVTERRSGKPHVPPRLPGNVPVSTTTTIGYESGGPYHRGGVYTGASTTVGTPGSSIPNAPDPRTVSQDPADIERDLVDNELAAGKSTVPVAGYLYFSKPKRKQRNPMFELTYRGAGAVVHLKVPSVK